jgi:hypothetical protein
MSGMHHPAGATPTVTVERSSSACEQRALQARSAG